MSESPAPAPVSGCADFFDHPATPWLLLSRLPGLGIRRWQALCEAFDDPGDLLKAGIATLKALGLPEEAVALIRAWQARDTGCSLLAELQQLFGSAQTGGIRLLGWGSDLYPEPLKQIPDPPLLLYYLGDPTLLTRPQISIVGSRNATRGGLDNARSFARTLSERGYLVTSGMAQGIDGAAHAGALSAGAPTVAVIGTGIDVVYPAAHRDLMQSIARHGLIVSEYAPGTHPRPGHFPRRNRIISGLSRGVLVVEANLRSGSLITARLALEQGREVFAIPGSIHNPQARGCHSLIRQGARLAETVDDIEEELTAWQGLSAVSNSKRTTPGTGSLVRLEAEPVADPPPAASPVPVPDNLAPREIAVLEALGYDPRSTDQLCSATGLPADQLMQSLLMLEMADLVVSAPGGYQRLI